MSKIAEELAHCIVANPGRKRGRPKTMTDEQRREKILRVARQTLLELGYGDITIDVIASRCQISKQTFYRFFSNKLDLVTAMITDHHKTMLNLPRDPDEQLSVKEALIEIFKTDVGNASEHERREFIFFFLHEAHQYPEILILFQTHGPEQARRALARWLESRCARGEIDIDDTSHAAGMLMAMIFGPMANMNQGTGVHPIEARNRHIRKCIDIFFDGIMPKASLR